MCVCCPDDEGGPAAPAVAGDELHLKLPRRHPPPTARMYPDITLIGRDICNVTLLSFVEQ